MKTYGELAFGRSTDKGVPDKLRILSLQPHAAVMFKRLFPQVRIDAAPPIVLTATPDTCRDMDWFASRFPLKADDDTRAAIAERIAQFEAREENAQAILSGKAPARHSAFRPGEAPFPYQAQAAALCLSQGALLLADDVGLGKTVTAMALLAQGAPRPAAVVVEAHLSEQWKEEFEGLTTMTVHVVDSTKPYPLPECDLVVFRYSNVGGWNAHIAERPFRTVIWDEIQQLRGGPTTKKGGASRTLAMGAEVKLGLTATPVFNYGGDIFNIMEFLRPGAFGTEWEFGIAWCGGSARNPVKDPVALGDFLYDQRFMLRRTEKDVDKELPPLDLVVHEVDAETAGLEDQAETARVLAEKLLAKETSSREKGEAALRLDGEMRQLTGIAKAPAVAAYVRMLLESGVERVLLGGWHRAVYDIWQKHLGEFSPVLYTGSESPKQKRASRQAFIDGESRVMMISLRSGAGLNGLQHVCSDVVLGEFDWSPQVHKQLYGRLRRQGQKRQVTAHVLHTEWGADPVMMDVLGLKDFQARGIVDRGEVVMAPVTDGDRIKKLAKAWLERSAG